MSRSNNTLDASVNMVYLWSPGGETTQTGFDNRKLQCGSPRLFLVI
jgi:hypothetical protein